MAAQYQGGGVFSGYAPISGALPFGGGGAGAFAGLGGSPQQAMANLGPNYANAYNSSLQQNKSNYDNIMQGYQQTLASQTSAQQAIAAGQTQLYNDVIGGLQGIGASRAQDITDQAAQAGGAATQGLIGRGLGNTTVQDSINRGIAADKNKALTANSNSVAGLVAGYQSQIGQAGLNQAAQANMANSNLSQAQLAFMNSTQSGYPNAGAYGQLAMQFGQAGAAQANAAALGRLGAPGRYGAGAMSGLPGGGGGGGQKLGYVPSYAQTTPGGGYGGAPSTGGGGSLGAWAGAPAAPSANVFGSYGGGAGLDYGGGGDYGGGSTSPAGGGFNWAGASGSVAQGGYGAGTDYLPDYQDYGGGGDF